MYIYDFSQLLTYVIVGILIFILGFVLTKMFGIPKGEDVATANVSTESVKEEELWKIMLLVNNNFRSSC